MRQEINTKLRAAKKNLPSNEREAFVKVTV